MAPWAIDTSQWMSCWNIVQKALTRNIFSATCLWYLPCHDNWIWILREATWGILYWSFIKAYTFVTMVTKVCCKSHKGLLPESQRFVTMVTTGYLCLGQSESSCQFFWYCGTNWADTWMLVPFSLLISVIFSQRDIPRKTKRSRQSYVCKVASEWNQHDCKWLRMHSSERTMGK